jgi:hypothetical protein
MPGPGNILITVEAATSKAVSEMSNFQRAMDSSLSTSDRMRAGLRAAAIPAAAALAAIAAASYKAVEAAEQHQAVSERLATSLHNTTGATTDQADAMMSYIDHLELASGISESQLAPAFQVLAKATGDTSDAQGLLNIAMDVSASSGKDVVTVANAMAKAHEGNIGALARVVPGLSEATKKSGDFNTAMAELSQTTGGAWVNAANTAEGQQKRLGVAVDQLNRSLGAVLLPILQEILPLLTRLAVFATDNTKAIQILVAVVATLSAGILVANAAMKAYEVLQVAIKAATVAWTAAQWLLNAALEGNPIGVVIVAVAALAAGIIYAYKHSETFRDVVHGAFAAVEAAAHALAAAFSALLDAASAAFAWIAAHWQLGAFAFGPLAAAVDLIADHWNTVAGAARAAGEAMAGAINAVVSAIHSAISAVEALIGALGRIHVPSISLPHIPGVLSAPVVAGAGSPFARGAPAPTWQTSGGATTTINVYGAVDPEGTARTIQRLLAGSDRRMGRTAR